MDTPSLADIAAVTKDNDFGGASWIWVIVLFLFMFGWNRNGNTEQPVTESSLCSAMNFNNLENAVGRLSDNENLHMMQLSQGLATVGYENLRNFADTQQTIQNGDYAISNQLSDCCCKTQRAIDGVNYNNAMNTAAINENTTAQIQKVIDELKQDKIDTLQAQVSKLQLDSALCGVIRYPMSTAWSAGNNPFFNAGYGCGYGTAFTM